MRRLLTFTPFRLSLRQQLLLISLVLLVIPLLGSQYISELERFLRQDQESRLLESARVIATAIATQPPLSLELAATNRKRMQQQQRFIRPLKSPIFLDGYADDWFEYKDRIEHFPKYTSATPVSFDLLSGYYQRRIYFFMQVRDKTPYYRPDPNKVTQADHVLIVTEDSQGRQDYVLSTYSPGMLQAVTVRKRPDQDDEIRVEPRISAVWTETESGYNIEMQIPESLMRENLSLQYHDVNRDGREQVVSIHPDNKLQSIPINLPSKPLQSTLASYFNRGGRAWLINNQAKIVAMHGSIYDQPSEDWADDKHSGGVLDSLYGLIRLIYLTVLPQPAEVFRDETLSASALSGKEIDTGLNGSAVTQWRLTSNERVNILRAVQPVIHQGQILGAVVLEKNSNSILLLQNRAVEVLMNTSIVVFLLSTLILLIFATRLSYRIQRLRDDTEQVISPEGKISGDLSQSKEQDEIGDLRSSFITLLNRLQEYNRYLEGMASKLSHELRTPVTVVKSSLENLEQLTQDPDQNTYLSRAQEGVNRLNHILTRMSEASRLEQSLLNEPRQVFSLYEVVKACASAYDSIHPAHKIRLIVAPELENNPLKCHGSADLIAQMLDKLVSNALDFALKDSEIDIVLQPASGNIELLVRNLGPALPQNMQSNLFDSMVSVRDNKSGDSPHLGLGLYIVRMIAQFHSGKPFARNIHTATVVEQTTSGKTTEPEHADNDKHSDNYNGVEIGVEIPHSSFDDAGSGERE